MRTSTRRGVAASLALVAGLSLTACGGDGGDAESDAQPTEQATATVDPAALPPAQQLQPFTEGVIAVDGDDGSLTQDTGDNAGAASDFEAISAFEVTKDSNGDSRAYERLCLGDVDVVDASTTITPQEWAQCQANGLKVYQYQVGADGIVLAIKNETDVGGDCLSTTQAREIFRAGSDINNWTEVGEGYDDVPLEAGGPDALNPAFQFFSRSVLDLGEPSITGVRSDYVVGRDEQQTELFVTGDPRDVFRTRNIIVVTDRYQQQKAKLAAWNAVVAGKEEEVTKALQNRRKGFRDKRPLAQQREDEARVQAAFAERRTAIIRRNRIAAVFEPINEEYLRVANAQRRLDDAIGNVALFGFSYYSTHEQSLRPFEIQDPESENGGQQNCIFPSPQTILNGQYPLSRPLLLTTTDRSLAREEVRQFLYRYLERAQDYAASASAIPISEADVARQQRQLRDGTTPEIESVDGGPVIVQPEEEEQVAEEEDGATPPPTASVPAR